MSPRRRRRPRPEEEQSWSASPSRGLDPVDIEIDLHGMRAYEAVPAIEQHIQRCHGARLHISRINHGHGTGVLKQIARETLTKSPLVLRHYPASYGDGGGGITIAEMNYGGHKAFNRRTNNSIIPKALPRK
jgi:DNA-nicking Smr family endonuclease